MNDSQGAARLRIWIIIVLILSGLCGSPTARAQITGTAKNTIFLEALGNGILYSFNYDRVLSELFSVRVGYSSFDAALLTVRLEATTIPVLINFIPGEGNHRLELGMGVDIIPRYDRIEGQLFTAKIDEGKFTGVVFTSTIGYRYQPQDGGMNFRICLTPVIGRVGFLSAGISFGYSF